MAKIARSRCEHSSSYFATAVSVVRVVLVLSHVSRLVLFIAEEKYCRILLAETRKTCRCEVVYRIFQKFLKQFSLCSVVFDNDFYLLCNIDIESLLLFCDVTLNFAMLFNSTKNSLSQSFPVPCSRYSMQLVIRT